MSKKPRARKNRVEKRAAAQVGRMKARLDRVELAHQQTTSAVPMLIEQLNLMMEQRRLLGRVISVLCDELRTSAGVVRINFAALDAAPSVGFGSMQEGDTTYLVLVPPLEEDPDPGPVNRTAVLSLATLQEQDHGRQEAGEPTGSDRTAGEGPVAGDREA